MAESMESTNEEENDEISMMDLFATLIKHKKIIYFITSITAIIVLLFVIGSLVIPPNKSYLPNLYTPKAIMLISSSGSGGLSSMLGGSTANLAALAGVNISGGKSNGQLAVFLAKSNSTLDELNDIYHLSIRYRIKRNPKTETRKAINKMLVVAYDDKTATCTVSFTDRDPVFAQAIVNKVVEILDRRFSALGGGKALETQKRLETKLADVNTQISILESRAKAFVSKYGVIDVDAMATEQVTVLAKLRSELIMKDMEIENYEKFSKIDDPVIKRLRSERESFSAKINEIEKGQTLLPGQKEIPKLSFEYAELKRDLMVQEEMYKLLIQQYEMAKFSAESQEPAFQVLELAEVPDQKSGPSRVMICIVATFASFFVSILIAFLLEAIKNVRNDPVAMKKLRGGV
jgi:tyrosine-protein kinase Etk/Wzc